ncbi:glycoside hydrolase family 43 [Pararcticibacter amylolyticus]|uniref:Glycoside hydrolase family 43 n=2 Tax=Pararcticibacter amylolyticus TaxID=2173175 RepID=A0A2U2PKI7_9SPHI|nr:glycoside hydrolase family 43 [Pararcticibacter amylolyticus]
MNKMSAWGCGVAGLLLFVSGAFAQIKHDTPGAGNPIIPGYFADPTVKKFGDTWYIYATTDGNGGGLGPPQVWESKDFLNWRMKPMNWPNTPHYWAPDVTRGADGKYYLYYCQPVEIYGASGPSPSGPWTPLMPGSEPIVKNYRIPDVITLDGQTFRDDDGKMYMFWGTWGIYPNSGCGIGLLNSDMKSFSKFSKLPNTVAKDFFEAPFMFKRNGIYYLTYSSGRCEDETYRVQYVMSKTGPMGPFEYGKNNPVLVTNEDGSVHGPGHQSVISEGDDFYLVYHRHNNPHSGGGFHRQLCADELEFDSEGNILKVSPTHEGIGLLAKRTSQTTNLASGKPVQASSFYSEDFRPSFATDDNNGTLWKAADNMHEAWLQIDLEKVVPVKRVQIQFEYATWYYQYLIEYSTDGKDWRIFADKSANRQWGSPMEDYADVKARFLRIKITGTQYPGLNKAIWNVKVYNDKNREAGQLSDVQPENVPDQPAGLLIDLDASLLQAGSTVTEWRNSGASGGKFLASGAKAPYVSLISGKTAVVFSGREYLESNFGVPSTCSGNSSFTVSMWVFNPAVEKQEPVFSWADGRRELSRAVIGYGSDRNEGGVIHGGWPDQPYKSIPEAGKWHHIAVVFDGTKERVFVDGKLHSEENKMLFLKRGTHFYLGSSEWLDYFYKGALAELKMYDKALSEDEIKVLSVNGKMSSEVAFLDPTRLSYGRKDSITNEGNAAGFFICRDAVIEDKGGRISLGTGMSAGFRPSGFLEDKLKSLHAFTVSASVYSESDVSLSAVTTMFDDLMGNKRKSAYKGTIRKGMWHQVMLVKDQGLEPLVYIDGRLAEKAGEISGEKVKLRRLNISNLAVFGRAIPLSAIDSSFTEWQRSFEEGLAGLKPVFMQRPHAVSDDMVSMAADPSSVKGGKPQYYFIVKDGIKSMGSGWQEDPSFISYNLRPGNRYLFSFKVKDQYGNISALSDPVEVKMNTAYFSIYEDSFDGGRDFLAGGMSGSFWDGLTGKLKGSSASKIASVNGSLILASSGSNWDGSEPAGPFLYKETDSDFVIRVEITDITGLAEKRPVGANEAGLMVRLANGDVPAGRAERLIQNGIMPGWGIGNLVTNLGDFGRLQTNNASAWEYDRHLQIRKQGDMFYIQSSKDGHVWYDLPGSPVKRPDLNGPKLQVGIFHAAYGKQAGFGTFDNLRIITPKAKD